jgi:hypothetical protein
MTEPRGSFRRLGVVFLAGLWIASVTLLSPLIVSAATPPQLSISPSVSSLSNGESITLSVGPNSFFTPFSRVNVLECAETDGHLPTDISTCDGNTIQAETVLVGRDGSFTVPGYTVYQLPSGALGEQANDQPICNESSPCVLYVGQDQNDFTAPKLFSAPFLIGPSAATAPAAGPNQAVSPAGAGLPQSAGGVSPMVSLTPPLSAGTTGVAAGSSGSGGLLGDLAHTGIELLSIIALGLALVLAGSLIRRAAVRGAP